MPANSTLTPEQEAEAEEAFLFYGTPTWSKNEQGNLRDVPAKSRVIDAETAITVRNPIPKTQPSWHALGRGPRDRSSTDPHHSTRIVV